MTQDFRHIYYRAKPWLTLAVAVLVMFIGGALYGSYAQRWGPSVDLVSAANQLKEMPRQLGSWTAVEEFPLTQSTMEMLECAGYISRRYVNRDTGNEINMAIIVGPPGPTAVHTPEICFSSRAYEQKKERQLVDLTAVSGDQHTFWSVDFSTRNVLADGLRVYYAWSLGHNWLAVNSARFEFAGAPMLYKIQLASPIAPRWRENSSDSGRQFLKALTESGWKLTAD